MKRLPLSAALAGLVAFFAAVTSGSASEPQEGGTAAQRSALIEEVRLLRLQVARLEQRVAALEGAARCGASEVFGGAGVFGVQPITPPVVPWPPAGPGLPRRIELPPTELPSRDFLPWNWHYDTGLYVFPGLDAPE